MSKKILIVEDEEAILKLLADTLAKKGYTVILAKDGQEALKQFEKENPDLILLDIIIPELSGFAVLEKLRIQYESKVPVIIISNLAEKENFQTGKKFGVVDYVIKSDISLKNLMVQINSILAI